MEEITITRTGDRPLVFTGETLATASSKYDHNANRWHEIAVHTCAMMSGYVGLVYVVVVEWRTTWQGENDHTSAVVLTSENEAVEYLRGIDPLEYLVGFPPGLNYADKQRRVEREIKSRWLRALTEVLGALGPERLG